MSCIAVQKLVCAKFKVVSWQGSWVQILQSRDKNDDSKVATGVLALQQTGNLPQVYAASHPMEAGTSN